MYLFLEVNRLGHKIKGVHWGWARKLKGHPLGMDGTHRGALGHQRGELGIDWDARGMTGTPSG